MHGDKSQSQRERALARFERGEVDTLVATDVAARGIDVADVTHVINFDAPEDRDSYVHRIGRTGRAGRDGAGVSFVLADQASRHAPHRPRPRPRPRVQRRVCLNLRGRAAPHDPETTKARRIGGLRQQLRAVRYYEVC